MRFRGKFTLDWAGNFLGKDKSTLKFYILLLILLLPRCCAETTQSLKTWPSKFESCPTVNAIELVLYLKFAMSFCVLIIQLDQFLRNFFQSCQQLLSVNISGSECEFERYYTWYL